MRKSPLSILVLCLIVMVGCSSSAPVERPDNVYVPPMADYSDMSRWHIAVDDSLSGADVFYIPSTWEYDWTTADGRVSHWADPSNPKHRADVENEMAGVAGYMADGNRFYSPHYRHITLDSWATLN